MGQVQSLLGQKKTEINVLILGQTGVGKTALFNFLSNITVGNTPDGYRTFHTAANERNSADQRESQTDKAQVYEFKISNDLRINFIDTPGLAEMAGYTRDQQNVRSIVETLNRVHTIDAVLIIANGTLARLDRVTAYVMAELRSIFPVTIMDNLLLLLTNCTASTVSFDKRTLGFDVKGMFFLQNPFALWTKMNRDAAEGIITLQSERAERMQEICELHGRSLDCVRRLASTVAGMPKVPTREFERVYNKKCSIELEIVAGVVTIQEVEKKKQQLSDVQADLALATADKDRVKDRLKDIIETPTTVQVPTGTVHNTLCGQCTTNCHEACGLERSVDKEIFKKCSGVRGETCKTCGHSYILHFHGVKKWQHKVMREEIQNEANTQVYNAATLVIDNTNRMKAKIEFEINECELKANACRKRLLALLEEYRQVCLAGSFEQHVANMITLMDLRMQAESNPKIREVLRRDKEELAHKMTLLQATVAGPGLRGA